MVVCWFQFVCRTFLFCEQNELFLMAKSDKTFHIADHHVRLCVSIFEISKIIFVCLYLCIALLRGAGGTVVMHVSLTTVTSIRFRPRAVIWLKLPLSHVRRVLSSLTLPSIAGFLRVFPFPPVLTVDPWGVALAGSSKENSSGSW